MLGNEGISWERPTLSQLRQRKRRGRRHTCLGRHFPLHPLGNFGAESSRVGCCCRTGNKGWDGSVGDRNCRLGERPHPHFTVNTRHLEAHPTVNDDLSVPSEALTWDTWDHRWF